MKTFREGLRNSNFVITAQLPLTPGTTADDVRNAVATLQPTVHAVQISDNTSTRPHMAPLAAASLTLQAGVDAVLQMSCRDRNRIALQSEIMGAAALGVSSFILTRGEKLPAEHKQRIKGVFDIGAQRLTATALAVSANERLVAPPGFLIGSSVTVIDPPEGWTAEGIDGKAQSGVKFLQTQPCLDVAILKRYMAALVARKALQKVSVIAQVPLAQSMEILQELQRKKRPLLISPSVLERLQTAENFTAEVESVGRETVREIRTIPGIAGVNIAHFSDVTSVSRCLC